MRELKDIERLARQLVAEARYARAYGEYGFGCDGKEDCRARTSKTVPCSKCGESVEVVVECGGSVDCQEMHNGEVAVELGDDIGSIVRELELALVRLDVVRSNSEPSILLEVVSP